MNAELSAVCANVLSAVLNGMAQGILLVLLLAAVFRVFRKMNAATRHGLELLTLAILVALPLAHFFSLPSESADSLAPGTSFAAAEDHPAWSEPREPVLSKKAPHATST